MAAVYAAIANGGKLVKPRVGKAVISSTGQVVRMIEPEVNSRIPVNKKTLTYLQNSLPGVITRGTATGAFNGFPNDQIPVAGKTGTGEVIGKGDTAWFVAYAPVNKPKYVVAVTISQGGTGGTNAAPAVRAILEAIYGVKGSRVDPSASVFAGGAPATLLPKISADGQVVLPPDDASYRLPEPRLPINRDTGVPLIALPELVSIPREKQNQSKPQPKESKP